MSRFEIAYIHICGISYYTHYCNDTPCDNHYNMLVYPYEEKKGALYMSQVVNVNFRMDAELKKSMEEVCADIGINLTTAFTIFAKKVSRERRIPFELSADPFYSENNMKYLEKIISDIDEGRAKLVEHDLIEVD